MTTPTTSPVEEPYGFAEWYVVFQAENVVASAAVVVGLLKSLTVDQVRALRFIGVSDDHWWRIGCELDERGVA